MIGLKIDGQIAELNPDTRIDIKLVNPLFNEETLSPGSYTLPFDMAGGEVSPINASIFKNIDVIESQEKFTRRDAAVFFDGVLFKKGKIKAQTVSSSMITSKFTFGLSSISEEIKTKKIRELLAEEIVIDASNVAKKIFVKPRFTTPFPLIVNGKTYESDTLANLAAAINANTDIPKVTATVITTGNSSGGLAAPYMILQSTDSPNDPHAELSVELEGGLNQLYDNTTGAANGHKWQVHTELGDVNLNAYYDPFWTLLQGYFTGAYPTSKIRFPVIFNEASSNPNKLYNGIRLEAAAPALIRNTPSSLNSFNCFNANSLHPFVRVKYLLETIATYFGFQFEGDFYTSADTDQMLIWNPNNLDLNMKFVGGRSFNFWKRSFNVKDLVPDITVVEFLRGLATRYNLAIYPNGNKVRIVQREPIAKATLFSDVTKQCSPPAPGEDLSISGVKLSSKKESKDLFAIDDIYNLGEPEVKLETIISTLNRTRSISGVSYVNGTLTGPLAYHPPEDKFELRLLYFKGMVNNGSMSYPEAGINAINYNDQFSGATGLYEKLWKRWLMYELKRRSVPIEIDFSFAELKNFDWEIKRRFDRCNYLVKSLDFSLENTRITVCKAVIYSMV